MSNPAISAQTLLEALGGIDDRLLSDARSNRKGWKLAAVAACAAGAVAVTALRLSAPSLPLLSVAEPVPVGMGFEGYMAYDISELRSGNPWREGMEFSTLPVYRVENNENFAAAEEYLLDLAGRMGVAQEELEITDNTPDQAYQEAVRGKMEAVGEEVPEGYFDPTCLIGRSAGLELRVDRSMTAEIFLEPAVSLPEGYSFTHHSSYEETKAAAEWLLEQYRSLLDMEEPRLSISGGDYNMYLQQSYTVEFYEGAGTDRERILNYQFRRAAFYCNDEGKLFLIRIWNPDLSQELGEYPILSDKEARKQLLSGAYFTTVPYDFPSEGDPLKTELTYLQSAEPGVWMPFYRFYAELPLEHEGDLKIYGAYYVPAVKPRYYFRIENSEIIPFD